MLPQIVRMKTSRKVTEFLYGGATLQIMQVLWNSRFGNQGANNIVNLWLPDAMIQWSYNNNNIIILQCLYREPINLTKG